MFKTLVWVFTRRFYSCTLYLSKILPFITDTSPIMWKLHMFLKVFLRLSLYIVIFQLLNCVQLFVTSWTVAWQSPPSMGFPKQKYWSGLPFPSPGNLPDPVIEPVDSLPLSYMGSQYMSTVLGGRSILCKFFSTDFTFHVLNSDYSYVSFPLCSPREVLFSF